MVDLPQLNQLVKDRLIAYGWALSEDRIKRVSAYVDRIYVKDCTIGLSRPDVSQTFPSFPNSDQAGWTIGLDLSSLPEGKHELVFQAESEKGAIRDLGAIPIIIDH